MRISNIHTLTGSGTTVHDPIWGITGTVRILKLYGVVTTSLGVHQTAVSYRLNDQTAVLPITSAAGITISAAVAGSSVAVLITTLEVVTSETLTSDISGGALSTNSGSEAVVTL